uniref:Uncharacterized protein n=1 Tax=Schistocephalus solidus TaxID=70667 RepID=A0A0X3PQP8_SCHSO
MTLDVKNQGFEKNLGELSLLESESEKSGLFNTNLLTWEVKTQTIDAAFQRAQLIITKQNEANAYKYVVERLKIWENESTEDDKREKHQYVAKKVKELSNSEASANIAFKLVILRELLSEINALDETFEVVTKTQSDIERDALIFLRDFTKAEGLDTEWLKALEKYEDTGDSSEATKINVGPNLHEQVLDLKTTPCTQIKTDGTFNSNNLYSECKWEENRVRYTLFPSLTSSTVSTGGFKSHRFAMPEEVQNFYSPLEPFKNGWTTKAQSKQVNIPAGGLHRTAPLNRQNRTDADTGVIRNVVENGSAASASLPEGRQVWNNISKPANVEFEAYSPVSGGKVKPSFFPRSIEKFDPGATKQSLPKVEFHLTAATKLLAMLAESDDKCERMHHPRTKLGQPENPQIYEKPANSTTEWPPQIHPLPRVIYRLARTQTADVLKVKESTVQEPSSQKTDDAKSKTFQTTGCGQPVISYIPTSTDMTSLSKDTNGDSHANKSSCVERASYISQTFW